ncbi:MAG: hypothetical protein ACYTGH_21305 [Planctomycetota bacterium]
MAARLPRLPGLRLPVFETNGAQNYRNWSTLEGYHPMAGASWTEEKGGCFTLDDSFYRQSGGILERSPHYMDCVS